MAKARKDRLQGTLEMLILRTLTQGPTHGYGVAQHIERVSEGVLLVDEGSLYPALYRLERAGLVDSQWTISDKNRRAKFYRLTHAGRKQLEKEEEDWARAVRAVQNILRYA